MLSVFIEAGLLNHSSHNTFVSNAIIIDLTIYISKKNVALALRSAYSVTFKIAVTIKIKMTSSSILGILGTLNFRHSYENCELS
jgi:hypothetical protein